MAVTPDELVSTGLAALCGVGDDSFNDKHWGAAIITTGLIAGRAVPSTRAAIIRQAELLINARSSWFPSPRASGPAGIEPIVDTLSGSVGELHLLGHDTIFASLALRAMNEQPDLATTANVQSVVSLIVTASARGPGGPFPGWDDPSQVRADDSDPTIDSIEQLATSALQAFTAAGPVGDGRHRGVVQHVLTHARALIDLDDLCHTDVASAGFLAHRTYRKLMTRRPVSVDGPLPSRADVPDFDRAEYWNTLGDGHDWLFGHVFKVAYAWPSLVKLAPRDVSRRARPMLATSMAIT